MDNLEFPRMVYRSGTMAALESGRYDHKLVQDADDLADAQADGWHLDQYAAKDAKEAAEPATTAEGTEPTRAELEQQAAAKGIKFDGRTSDKKLAALIAGA